TVGTGNLLPGQPVDVKIVQGAWAGGDLRQPYAEKRPTQDAMVAAGLLLVAALAAALWRRRPAPLATIGSVGRGAPRVAHRSSPYYTVKAYQVLSVAVICGVVAGAAALVERRSGWPRIVLAGVAVVLLGGWAVTVKRSLDLETTNASLTPSWLTE